MLKNYRPEIPLEAEEKILDNLLKLLHIPWLTKSIFHPFIEIYMELKYLVLDRHMEKSLLKVFTLLILGSASGMFIKPHNLMFNVLIKIMQNLNLSPFWGPALSELLTILIVAHMGWYLTKVIANFACNFLYKDKEFYVTKRKINQLKEKFHQQGYPNFTNEDILRLINFCKKNLRNRTFTDFLGDKRIDWKKILKAIIYEADLEPFLDQQQTLKFKLNDIKRNRLILDNYLQEKSKSLSDLSCCKISMATIEVTEQNKAPVTPPQMLDKVKCTSPNYSKLENNTDPKQPTTFMLGKMKIKYLCENLQKNSEEMLIYNYKYALQYKYIDTSIAIYPEQIINNITLKPLPIHLYAESEEKSQGASPASLEQAKSIEIYENSINLSPNFAPCITNKPNHNVL